MDNQNVHLFPFEAFFSYDVFKSNLKKVSDRFDLKIDWTQEAELKKDFETGLSRDKLRLQIIEVQKILDAISSGSASSWQLSNLAPKIINRDFESDKLFSFVHCFAPPEQLQLTLSFSTVFKEE